MEVVIRDTPHHVNPESPVQDLINELQAKYNDIKLKLEYDGQTLDNELTWEENEIPPLTVELEIQHSLEFTNRCNKILFDEIYKGTKFCLKEYIERGGFEYFHLIYAKYEKDLPVYKYVNNIPLFTRLIEAGANVNTRDNRGRTALMFATNAKQTKSLIEAGADVNAQDEHGMTALMGARNEEQTKSLIEAGANVNARNIWGRTALMYAKAEQIKSLIEAGADVNAQDGCGWTVLMLTKNAEKYTLLTAAGATR